MTEGTPLGNFNILPSIVREQIWQNLLPSGHDDPVIKTPVVKADLNILCTSRALEEEISQFIYDRGALTFEVTARYEPDIEWIRLIYFHNLYKQEQATWIVKNVADAAKRGLATFPIHRLKYVGVCIDPGHTSNASFFGLYLKICSLLWILNSASRIRRLSVSLVSHGRGEWYNRRTGEFHRTYKDFWDHDVAFLPFCTLRNIKKITFYTCDGRFLALMDSTNIANGMTIVNSHSWPFGPRSTAPFDVDQVTANHRLVLLDHFWFDCDSALASQLRIEILRTWFVDGHSGISLHENSFRYTMLLYPSLILNLSPLLVTLKAMHVTLLACYGLILDQQRLPHIQPKSWDSHLWLDAFPRGIRISKNKKFGQLVTFQWPLYLHFVASHGFLRSGYELILKWDGGEISRGCTAEDLDRVNPKLGPKMSDVSFV
ncbi:hypothetical protein BDV25DRAFT_142104 [Aspergillus avenaceus]|uniref:Uncharacterized protein n=1 Tax=Aspergillus avenaceus TaxID=36643 RepID=A0A5N6TP06_ASPAV|nr:hypothetical protein BDV25DRAFT_142104 [Aspergillus avenaceus]